MTGGVDQRDPTATTVTRQSGRRDNRRDVQPSAQALAAAATVAFAEDLDRAAAALAREACGLARAAEACVRLKCLGNPHLVARHRPQTDCPRDRKRQPCASKGQSVRTALTWRGEHLGDLTMRWAVGSPDAGVISPELTALCNLAAAQLKVAVDREEQRCRLRALDDLAMDLRRQVHEYATRMQVLSGLHELGDNDAAHRFLAEMVGGYQDSPAVRAGQIRDPVIAGTLVALMRVAQQREIWLELEAGSSLRPLPSTLKVLDLVTVLTNCVANAIDAAATQRGQRRRVAVSVMPTPQLLNLSVRDWGPGVQGRSLADICLPGSSTKPGHHGVGLALVHEIVHNRGGRLELEPVPDGVKLLVCLPWD